MFNNENKNKTLPKVESYIAQDTLILGTINSTNGTLRIDGEVKGDVIKSHGIIVGENGKITGDLQANLIIIAGEVTGDVVAFEKLEILNKAKLIGNLETPLLSIAEGCVFQGNCKMIQRQNSKIENKK